MSGAWPGLRGRFEAAAEEGSSKRRRQRYDIGPGLPRIRMRSRAIRAALRLRRQDETDRGESASSTRRACRCRRNAARARPSRGWGQEALAGGGKATWMISALDRATLPQAVHLRHPPRLTAARAKAVPSVYGKNAARRSIGDAPGTWSVREPPPTAAARFALDALSARMAATARTMTSVASPSSRQEARGPIAVVAELPDPLRRRARPGGMRELVRVDEPRGQVPGLLAHFTEPRGAFHDVEAARLRVVERDDLGGVEVDQDVEHSGRIVDQADGRQGSEGLVGRGRQAFHDLLPENAASFGQIDLGGRHRPEELPAPHLLDLPREIGDRVREHRGRRRRRRP